MMSLNSEVDYFISVISLFLGIIFDYVFFYLISPIKKNIKKDSIFICTTFPLVFIFSGAGDRMAFYTELVEVTLFYFVYKRRIIDYGILGRLLLIQSYSYITYGVENLFFQLIGKQDTSINSMICGFIFVLIEYILFTKTTVVENLDNEYGKVYFFLILYLYFGSIAVYYLANYVIKIDILAYTIAIIIIIGQLIFSLYIYNNSKKIRQDKLSLQQIKDLKIYTQQLESSQRSLRKFKHDYQNMLLSLKLSAKKSHDKELIDKLAEYSSKILEDKVLWQFNDVDNVKDELLKSLFISKLNRIFQDNIQYSFECRDVIDSLSNKYNAFDIIRILGITYDNAIEESLELGDEARIDTMVYRENGELEIEIKNRCRNTDLTIQDMRKSGFTTKKNHDGLGLANIEELSQPYNDIFINYQIKDGWFTFLMVMSI